MGGWLICASQFSAWPAISRHEVRKGTTNRFRQADKIRIQVITTVCTPAKQAISAGGERTPHLIDDENAVEDQHRLSRFVTGPASRWREVRETP